MQVTPDNIYPAPGLGPAGVFWHSCIAVIPQYLLLRNKVSVSPHYFLWIKIFLHTVVSKLFVLLCSVFSQVNQKIPTWMQHFSLVFPNPTKNQNGNFTAFMPDPVNATRNDVYLPNTIIPWWLYITCRASMTHTLLHPSLIHFILQISRSLPKTLCFLTTVIQREQNSPNCSIIKNKSVIIWMIKINGNVLQLVSDSHCSLIYLIFMIWN